MADTTRIDMGLRYPTHVSYAMRVVPLNSDRFESPLLSGHPIEPTMVFSDDREVHADASLKTSLAALIPDSTAPSIHPCFSEVCSPAKWI